MTALETFLLAITICSLASLYIVMQRSVPSSVAQDSSLEIVKLKHELGHALERVGAYSANMDVLRTDNAKLDLDIHNLQVELDNSRANYSNLLHQKKSSEVKVGQLSEQVIGLVEGFEYDTKQMRFLGSPFDYVVFGDDMITFLEVKTGGSQLSQKQKHLRSLIESGKVEFKLVRLTEKGLNK